MASHVVEKEDIGKVNEKFPQVLLPLNPEQEGLGLNSSPVSLLSWLLQESHLAESHLTDAGLEFLLNVAATYWISNSVTSLLHFQADNYNLRVSSPNNIAMVSTKYST